MEQKIEYYVSESSPESPEISLIDVTTVTRTEINNYYSAPDQTTMLLYHSALQN